MIQQNDYHEEDIDLREYIGVLSRHWKTILLFAFGLAFISLLLASFQPSVYEAKTTLLMASQGGGSISGLSGLAGLAGIAMPKNGNIGDLTELVKSQAVAAKVLDDLSLSLRLKGWDQPDFNRPKQVDAVRGMLAEPIIKGNLIELKAFAGDPKLAADLANGFAQALAFYWYDLNYSENRKKKEYIEGQLPRVEEELKKAEDTLKKYTRLSALPKFPGAGSGLMSSAQSQGLEVARLAREIEIQSTVYTMLRKDYETVKLEESKEIPPFAVVDGAQPRNYRVKPQKKKSMLVGFAVGLCLGIAAAFIKEYWRKSD